MRLAPPSPSPGRFSRRLAACVLVLLTLVVPAAIAMNPVPLDWKHTVGDPSIVRTSKKYVVIATGAKVSRALSKNGKVWKWKTDALAALPAWANPSGGDVWAADMAKVGSHYVLYFAAPVRGVRASSRCIGVATSATPTGTFYPVAGPPLVCPTWFKRTPAADRIVDRASLSAYASASAAQAASASAWAACESSFTSTPSSSPTSSVSASPSVTPSPTASLSPSLSPPVSTSSGPSSGAATPTTRPDPCTSPSAVPPPSTSANVIGAIDPSLFIDADGIPYLVYKTDGIPSSIRILQLTADGLHPADGAISQTLVTSTGVLENPVLLRRGTQYYLFNSYGDYARCSYSTVWRSSSSLFDWSTSVAAPLLTRRSTHKLCGPGGADVIDSPSKVLMYFEAWTCKNSYHPCHKSFWAYNSRDARQHPKRALYAVKLGFASGAPYVKKFLKGSKH